MPRVNPDILRWARQTAGLEPEEAARKIQLRDSRKGTAVDRLAALEEGEELPTRAMLHRMSKAYRRPLVAFYLADVPPKGDRGQDFRTLPVPPEPEDEAHLDALLRQIKARQRLVRAAMEDEDEDEPLAFVGSKRMSQGETSVAEAIRGELQLSIDEFRAAPNADEAFDYVREKAEAAGIFVLLMGDLGSYHTALDPVVFRGSALADPVAPFIVINDRDSHAAWTFTLLHELAHLWIGQTGVSGGVPEAGVERFCNDVASALLVDSSEIDAFPALEPLTLEARHHLIASYADTWNVSRSLIAYRLYRGGRIPREEWQRLQRDFRESWEQHRAVTRSNRRRREGGPDYYVIRRHRLGTSLVQLTGRMVASGTLTTTKAARILGVRPANVARLVDPTVVSAGR